MDASTPEAFLEQLIEYEGGTFESMVARSILEYVQELGVDGFDEYVQHRQNEIDAALGLQEQFFREQD
jgi:uncharacterized short protein YbdD (DUF466 family)